jgi:hypothetical protein
MSLYDKGAKALLEKDEKFDLKSEDVVPFMELLSHHAKQNGWDIFTIDDGTVPVAVPKNLLTQYGELTLENIKVFIDVVIAAANRQSQEDDQLFACLMDSLSKGARATVTLRSDDYTTSGELSGVLLLKVILLESLVDTKSTVNRLQAKLTAGLPVIMGRHGNNIKSFNKEVAEIQKRLTSYGKRPGEILPQLFDAYTTC